MGYAIKNGLLGKKLVAYECTACKTPLESPLQEAGEVFNCPTCGKEAVTPGTPHLNAWNAQSRKSTPESDQVVETPKPPGRFNKKTISVREMLGVIFVVIVATHIICVGMDWVGLRSLREGKNPDEDFANALHLSVEKIFRGHTVKKLDTSVNAFKSLPASYCVVNDEVSASYSILATLIGYPDDVVAILLRITPNLGLQSNAADPDKALVAEILRNIVGDDSVVTRSSVRNCIDNAVNESNHIFTLESSKGTIKFRFDGKGVDIWFPQLPIERIEAQSHLGVTHYQ